MMRPRDSIRTDQRKLQRNAACTGHFNGSICRKCKSCSGRRELTEIPAPPFCRDSARRALAARPVFIDLGLNDVHFDTEGNVLGNVCRAQPR